MSSERTKRHCTNIKIIREKLWRTQEADKKQHHPPLKWGPLSPKELQQGVSHLGPTAWSNLNSIPQNELSQEKSQLLPLDCALIDGQWIRPPDPVRKNQVVSVAQDTETYISASTHKKAARLDYTSK